MTFGQVEQPGRRAVRGGRLAREDVEPGAGDLAGGQRGVERVLVDEAAAGDVDDVARRLHLRELLRADHPGGLGRLRHVDRDEVALLEQLVEREQVHAELLGARARDVGVVRDDAHVEGLQTRGDERADAAEADDADGLLEQLGAGVRAPLPLALGERRVRGRDVAGEAQDVADRQLRGRDDVGCRRIDDHHAGGRRRPDVDVVEPDAGPCDDLQHGSGRERLGVDLRGGADQHRVRVGERREQRRPIGAVDAADVEVRSERIDRGG